jgi:peptidyl-prolyl cis-trans isomerase B (cyclophilin B)
MRKVVLFMMLFLISTLSFAKENNMSDTQTKVKLTTTLGEIIIQLNTEKAPVSSANFLTYVNEGFYNVVALMSNLIKKPFMARLKMKPTMA